MPARGRIVLDDRFLRLERELERGIERGLERGARRAAAAAAAAETRRESGALAGSIGATAAYRGRSRSGKALIAVAVIARDFKAAWHELGTLAKRRRKLAPRSRRKPRAVAIAARGGGITPLRYLSKGLRAGFPAVMAELQRELRRLRT